MNCWIIAWLSFRALALFLFSYNFKPPILPLHQSHIFLKPVLHCVTVKWARILLKTTSLYENTPLIFKCIGYRYTTCISKALKLTNEWHWTFSISLIKCLTLPIIVVISNIVALTYTAVTLDLKKII